MKTIRLTLCMLIAGMNITNITAQEQKGLEAITRRAVEGQLEFLASDWTEGRHTGRKGAYMSADYITSLFKVYGLEPGGDMEMYIPDREERRLGIRPKPYRSYYQKFSLIEYNPGEVQEFALMEELQDRQEHVHFTYRTDFSVNTSDVGIELSAPVIFVGYGYVNEEHGYDDYKNVDVEGKIILRLAGYPGYMDTASLAYKTFNPSGNPQNREALLRRNTEASERGVAAIIEVNMDADVSGSWAANIPFRYNSRMYEGDERPPSFSDTRIRRPGNNISDNMTRVSATTRVLNRILEGSGVNGEEFTRSVGENLKPASRALAGKKVRIRTTVDSRIIEARNVIGLIPGKDTSNVIVIGGHYDHLGIHGGYIWNGADDNASGTVGVMTVAKACMATGEKPGKTIVFAAWTAEEKGLLGSRFFTENPYNNCHISAYLNYDMISRDNPNDSTGMNCSMIYTSAYPQFEEMTSRYNKAYDLGLIIDYRPQERPGGGSDHTPFAQADVPVMYLHAGMPVEYHQADDHISKVNWEKMVRIIKIGYLNIWELANSTWEPE